MYDTVVVPSAKVAPGVLVFDDRTAPRLSVAVGSVHDATELATPLATYTVKSDGQFEITGRTASVRTVMRGGKMIKLPIIDL